MEARIAVLEEIAKATKDTLTRLEAGQAALRADMTAEFRAMRAEMTAQRTEARADYRWLLGIMLGMGVGLLGVMAKGFRWL